MNKVRDIMKARLYVCVCGRGGLQGACQDFGFFHLTEMGAVGGC